ncbi:hypothetical protein BU16DRAFT_559683 [Lophium mytilinum]|uniref:Uncharacterized protein n=1 Tax=Lophium mytilinum TaxID=390894 RepID=A0A6A6R297_9PEZI|nr:hypothetical protein BU16DRAFT_559683 [Lophium mytilinum]
MPLTKKGRKRNVPKTIRFAEAPQIRNPERVAVKQPPGSKTRATYEEENPSHSPNQPPYSSSRPISSASRSPSPYPLIPSQLPISPSPTLTLRASRLYANGASWNPKPAITAFHKPSLAPAATFPVSLNPWDEFYRVRDERRKKKTLKMRWFGIDS